MELYIVIIEDRRTDTTAHPFTDKNVAIESARRLAKEYCRDYEDYEEHDYGKNDGWLFYANYSCEGDSARVVTAELDKAI